MSEEIRETVEVVEENNANEEVEAAATEETAGTQGEKPGKKEKKYTDDDVDRIVSKRLTRERERLQKLFSEEQQISEIEQREQRVLMRELKADAKDILMERGLPTALAAVLNYTDKEEFGKSIDEVENVFNLAVERAVKQRLSGTTPRANRGFKRGDEALHAAFKP